VLMPIAARQRFAGPMGVLTLDPPWRLRCVMQTAQDFYSDHAQQIRFLRVTSLFDISL
jgi:hypothetical protein